MRYEVVSNSGVEKADGDLADFLSEFSYMFIANAIPPYAVIRDFCANDPSRWGAGNRVKWNYFDVDVSDYKSAIKKLSKKYGYVCVDVPDYINTAYKWSIWQYTVRYGVPFEEFLRLSNDEIHWSLKLEEAINKGDEKEVLSFHLMKVEASDELENFLSKYLEKP
ncbi:MAG: hypothetical protein SWN10_22875 [Pseudomonadota bacterium]|nr:hypothetical protein [Pseudomonadota bacterium]